MIVCCICDREICQNITGEPYLTYKKNICHECYIDLISAIYRMSGYGDGGIIHLIFRACLESEHNRKRRKTMANYKRIFAKIANKYNFECVNCGSKENLTIDHIRPISKGGTNEEDNLQILCKSCNSKKGAKYVR